MSKGISVVVTALNEEGNIAAAVESITGAFAGQSDDYEIVLINDGSRDRTGEIVEKLARANSKIRVFHNEENRGQAYSLFRGYQLAQKDYVTVFPGDNDISASYLRDFLREMGSARVLMTYMANIEKRGWGRRFLSQIFVASFNVLFGLRLRNYNGAPLYRREDIQSMRVVSDRGMTLLAECLVRILKSGATYKEIPVDFVGRKAGQSRAVSLRNLTECLSVLCVLVRDIYFCKKPLGVLNANSSSV